MWPLLLDMTKEESIQYLRNLELEAYSCLVSALRAQGPLNPDKRKLLKDTGYVLNITQERHKAEVRRAISDEKLNTVAYHITGHRESLEDWAQEGRRLVPLLPRQAPQTLYSSIANDASDNASQSNKLLPLPCSTERRRPVISPVTTMSTPEVSKNIPFRVPEPPKQEENVAKKRKIVSVTESSNVTPHLLTPKLCRIQQLYRQKSKPKSKELVKRPEQDHIDMAQSHRIIQSPSHPQTSCSSPQPQFLNQRINVLQNISLQPIKEEMFEAEETDTVNSNISDPSLPSSVPVCSNENQAPKPKLIANIKSNAGIAIKQSALQCAGPSTETHNNIKITPTKKPITKTVNSGQKLIVVSNAQTIPSNSILQRTLQIPFVKNISIKNFEKFKIVTSSSNSSSLQLASVTNAGVNSVKHKVVTVKTNPATKKVIPFSQLQVLNSKGSIKVLPLGGKIVGKSVSGSSSPLYIVNTTQQVTKVTPTQVVTTSKVQVEKPEIKVENITSKEVNSDLSLSSPRENGKSTVLEDIMKASGVISEENVVDDYDKKIDEFHISQVKNNVEVDDVDVKMEMFGVEENNKVVYEKLSEEYVESDIDDQKEKLGNVEEDITNEIIEEESSLHLDSHLSEEITTEEVPLDDLVEAEISKISDTKCN